MSESAASFFGEMISSYSRAQALADGVLVSVDPAMCKEIGVFLPVAISEYLWGVIAPDNIAGIPGQSVDVRLKDLLFFFRAAVMQTGQTDRVTFVVSYWTKNNGCPAQLNKYIILAVCGPGDEGEPVLTLMFPEDD